jgi:hypothetical protein
MIERYAYEKWENEAMLLRRRVDAVRDVSEPSVVGVSCDIASHANLADDLKEHVDRRACNGRTAVITDAGVGCRCCWRYNHEQHHAVVATIAKGRIAWCAKCICCT